MECARFSNSTDAEFKVVIEPWGNDYVVPKGFLLKVIVDQTPSQIHIDYTLDGIISIYLNGADLGLDTTSVEQKLPEVKPQMEISSLLINSVVLQ